MSQPSILTLRRRWCLEMAEQLHGYFNLGRRYNNDWDDDKAAKLIESFLPDTWDEAIAYSHEIDQLVQTVAKTVQPQDTSLGAQLRNALGFDDSAPLKLVLEAAIECALAAKNGEAKT